MSTGLMSVYASRFFRRADVPCLELGPAATSVLNTRSRSASVEAEAESILPMLCRGTAKGRHEGSRCDCFLWGRWAVY